MRKIPNKLRSELNEDSFYKKCCLTGNPKVEWHHAIIFQGRQLNEKWAIVPASEDAHLNRKEELELMALNRATDDELRAISKSVDYAHRRMYLDDKYNSKRELL